MSEPRTSPSEHRLMRDPGTGATVHQITNAECINHAPYFLTSAFTPDGSHILFTSYRSGAAQLYAAGFPDGPIRQLTDFPGLHPFSAVISPDGRCIYATRNDAGAGAIVVIDWGTLQVRELYLLEGGQCGECCLSPAGDRIVTAVKSAAGSGLAVVQTGGGGQVILEFGRTIIHPQFHPLHPDWIEFSGDPAPRMHRVRVDGSELECLYRHDNDEFVVHETFLGQTGDLVFTVWPRALKRLNWRTREVSTIVEHNVWHIAPNRAGSKVLCDTNHPDRGLQLIDVATGAISSLCQPGSSNGGSQWRTSRYALAADFAAARASAQESGLSWMEMPTDTVYGPQWSHPHPGFSADERVVTFTSDRSGQPQVYAVELP